MTDITMVEIGKITLDPEIQPRLYMDEGIVTAFYELYKEDGPDALPAVHVFHDADGVFWLAEGFYRVTAARKAFGELGEDEPRTLPVIIHEGSKRDAIYFAAGANGKHGNPLTNVEKNRVIELLLRDEDWRKKGDREIARHVGVSNSFVSRIHNEIRSETASVLGEQMPQEETIDVQRGDQNFKQKKGNRGGGKRSKSKPATTATASETHDDHHAAEPSEHLTNDSQDAITTTLAISLETQDEPHTDTDAEAIANDGQEAETTKGFDDLAVPNDRTTAEDAESVTDDDQEQNQEAYTSTAISNLKDAWSQATKAERMSFLQWLIHHEKDEMRNRALDALSALLEEQSNEDIQ